MLSTLLRQPALLLAECRRRALPRALTSAAKPPQTAGSTQHTATRIASRNACTQASAPAASSPRNRHTRSSRVLTWNASFSAMPCTKDTPRAPRGHRTRLRSNVTNRLRISRQHTVRGDVHDLRASHTAKVFTPTRCRGHRTSSAPVPPFLHRTPNICTLPSATHGIASSARQNATETQGHQRRAHAREVWRRRRYDKMTLAVC